MREAPPPGPDLKLEDAGRIRRLNAFYEEIRPWFRTDREQDRYGAAAGRRQEALCCPVEHDLERIAHIPQRILEIDYGCGDPTVHAEEGMTVLDLGSGSGKHAFMIARQVGPQGRVIGVDKTREMLELARGAVDEVMANLGHPTPNVEFRHGRIESLWVDGDRLMDWLSAHEIRTYDNLEALETWLAEAPLVADASVDLVVSSCVLNLVEDNRKQRLLEEIFRVLRRTGSLAISDIVSDEPLPAAVKDDPELWTGCVAGAWPRRRLLQGLAEAGFHGVTEVRSRFWKRVAGVSLFSVTVRAWKGRQGPCLETFRSAMYRGPFRKVEDDDGHVFERGVFTPVCDKTAELLSRDPYRASFHVTPRLEDPDRGLHFRCGGSGSRRELDAARKRRLAELTEEGACCNEGGCC